MNGTNTLKQLTNLTFWLPSKGLETKRLQFIRHISYNLVDCPKLYVSQYKSVNKTCWVVTGVVVGSYRLAATVDSSPQLSGRPASADWSVWAQSTRSLCFLPSPPLPQTIPTFSTSRHTLSLLLAYSSTAWFVKLFFTAVLFYQCFKP